MGTVSNNAERSWQCFSLTLYLTWSLHSMDARTNPGEATQLHEPDTNNGVKVVTMMWRYDLLLTLFVIPTIVAAPQATVSVHAEPAQLSVTLEVFTREGCPHCEEAKRFLADLHRELPDVQIVAHDIWHDPGALQRLRALAEQHGIGTPGVPAFYSAPF